MLWMRVRPCCVLVVVIAQCDLPEEEKEKNLLVSKLRKNGQLLDKLMLVQILCMATPMVIGTLAVFSYYYHNDSDMIKAWSMSLTLMAAFQWFNAWNCRDRNESIFGMNPFSNLWLILATIIVVVLQIIALYVPIFQEFLRTTPLTLSEWTAILVIASSIIWVEELRKAIYSWANRRKLKA